MTRLEHPHENTLPTYISFVETLSKKQRKLVGGELKIKMSTVSGFELASPAGIGAARPDVPGAIFEMIRPLLATIRGLTVRPVAWPSAIVCLATTHKLLILLRMIKIDTSLKDHKGKWSALVTELGRGVLKKWGTLGNAVPGSFMRLYLTQVELSITAIPDPEEIKEGVKLAARFSGAVIKSFVTMVNMFLKSYFRLFMKAYIDVYCS